MSWVRETSNGYKYDKKIFLSFFGLLVAGVLYICYLHNFDFSPQPYFNCQYSTCENPFYLMEDCTMKLSILGALPWFTTPDCKKNCEWCNEKTLAKGIYGTKTPPLFEYFGIGTVICFILVIFINHFIHNKGKKIDWEPDKNDKVAMWMWNGIKKMGENNGEK